MFFSLVVSVATAISLVFLTIVVIALLLDPATALLSALVYGPIFIGAAIHVHHRRSSLED